MCGRGVWLPLDGGGVPTRGAKQGDGILVKPTALGSCNDSSDQDFVQLVCWEVLFTCFTLQSGEGILPQLFPVVLLFCQHIFKNCQI